MREYTNTLYRGFKYLYTTSLYPLDPLISPIRTAENRFRDASEAVHFFYQYQSGTKKSTFLVTLPSQATPLSAQNPRITVPEKGCLFNNLVLEPQLVPPNPTIGTKK